MALTSRRLLLIAIIVFALCFFKSADAAPNVTFYFQNPADLNVTNFLGSAGVNITYNISIANLNYSSVLLFYKANSTTSNIFTYTNGTEIQGYGNITYINNNSIMFTWTLLDNEVLPASYNFDERALESTSHAVSSLAAVNQYLSIELLNISNATQYNFFEIMVNRSSGAGSLRVSYCNSSYNFASNPASNANCNQFYMLTTNIYHHNHTNYSSHMVIPFPINTSTGKIGTVVVTPTSYFLLRGQVASTWRYYYITNMSRTNAFRTSTNNGNTWTSQTFTTDAHLHQFGTNESLWYYACATNNTGGQNCTSARQDLLELMGLPPTSPYVYSPANMSYKGNISINYTRSESPNAYPIVLYNISLMNLDNTFNSTIRTNNSINLSYIWDNSAIADGTYNIRIEACDNVTQCSSGFSEDFTIDTKLPELTIISPTATTYSTNSIYFNVSSGENMSFCKYSLDSWVTNITMTEFNPTYFYNLSTVPEGSYTAVFWCNDSLGNVNATQNVSFIVDIPTLNTIHSTDGADPGTTIMGNITRAAEKKTAASTIEPETSELPQKETAATGEVSRDSALFIAMVAIAAISVVSYAFFFRKRN